ncbi:MAG TPA: endonuclease/exonuclease/phosphatase family protein [Nocardioides sp.]|nr:endonuclease/exonuclease/phosphatase family protein [Nocardioides sp.]
MRVRRTVSWAAVLAVLLPAALLTLSRLFEPDDGRLVRAASLAPLAIPLYAVLLVVALVWLVRRRRRRGRRRRSRTMFLLLAVVALAGLAAHAAWFSPLLVGSNPPAASGAEPLTVMTANLHAGRADGIDLVGIASEEGVDVLVVEEVTTRAVADMERAGVATLFPHRVGDASEGEGVEGLMVFSRLPLGEAVALPTVLGGWLVDVGDLSLLAVHVVGPTDAVSWRSDLDAVRRAAVAADADLVVGDLNATLDNRPMRLLAADGWRSAAELANEGWQPTWPVIDWLGLQVPALVQVDHVLVGRSLAALSARTLEIPGSDHRAVVAEVARK